MSHTKQQAQEKLLSSKPLKSTVKPQSEGNLERLASLTVRETHDLVTSFKATVEDCEIYHLCFDSLNSCYDELSELLDISPSYRNYTQQHRMRELNIGIRVAEGRIRYYNSRFGVKCKNV